MCGRFCIDQDMWKELKALLGELDQMFSCWKWNRPGQDIYPSNQSLVITGRDGRLTPELQKWGFTNGHHSSLVINARAETAAVKRMFRDSVENRRLVVPAARFYEWNKDKQKVTFYKKGQPALYMAGIYRPGEEGWNFCILTTEANDSMRSTHSRMPLILEKRQIETWIMDGESTGPILSGTPGELDKETGYEQLSLF